MPRGKLPRADTELVILRVAHNCGSEYEWRHHDRLARAAGLTAEQVERVRQPTVTQGWTERQALLIHVADELHERRDIPDDLWTALTHELSEVEIIELVMLVAHYEMLATTIQALRIAPDKPAHKDATALAGRRVSLVGRRVLITGAARGIGAATARRLHERGARLALAGLEPELLARVASDCGGAVALSCDVRDRQQVEDAVQAAAEQLGGLDVVIANASVAAQLPILGGDPAVFERTVEVNLLGVY
jgi:FlaA1/EpsC-like NDP-sugar epimerase